MAAHIKKVFKNYPLLANSVVYGSMCVGAEFSQQVIKRKFLDKKVPPDPFDTGALARYAVIGSCINSNLLYFWFNWLEYAIPGTLLRSIIAKLLLTQFILGPPFVASFYISMSLMERKEDLLEECREKFIPTFKTSCGFWLPAQTINFLLVPPPARVVYVGTCSFIWINILCILKREELHKVTD
ncbi:mpv17-like protein isoform X2 [Lycorma delicatula]|uniref:mpv17-like protein isoform X2 n=1 Tax=Lycorma delicatula TaxID=130591 RepID=UPI003F513D6D